MISSSFSTRDCARWGMLAVVYLLLLAVSASRTTTTTVATASAFVTTTTNTIRNGKRKDTQPPPFQYFNTATTTLPLTLPLPLLTLKQHQRGLLHRPVVVRCYTSRSDEDDYDDDTEEDVVVVKEQEVAAKMVQGTQTLSSATRNGGTISRRLALVRSLGAVVSTTLAFFLPNYDPSSSSALAAVGVSSSDDSDSSDTTTTNRPDKSKNVHIKASWSAVDGLNSLEENKQFVSFDPSAYKAMRDDPSRTPLFEQAIIRRLNAAPGGPASQTVLDLGTGPYALFSIIAAQHGAGRVYAIEANPQVAQSARETIAKLGYQNVITVLEGFSSNLVLPDNTKADFAVAEIVGSIATEEGAYATILDAHERLIKEPNRSSSWIPSRIQTFAAPASYTLHNMFQPPAFDWSKLSGEPVRFNCRDEGLQLLSNPVVVEDISFADIRRRGGGGANTNTKSNPMTTTTTTTKSSLLGRTSVVFQVDGDRLEDNTMAFYEELKRGRIGTVEAEQVAAATGFSFTGIALWPRLILSDNDDNDDTTSLVVNSRSHPDGGHQRSHWQTVLPIMCPTPVTGLKAGDKIAVTFGFDVSENVLQPPRYVIEGDVIRV